MTYPNWCDEIGESYVSDGWEQQPSDIQRTAYSDMVRVNRDLFADIPVPVRYVSDDPYENYSHMQEQVPKDDMLLIFDGGDTPEHMSHEENLQGRAVHDWYGHLQHDCDFSPMGEFTKWYRMIDHYPQTVTQLLFGEVVGQVAAIHYVDGFDYQQRPCIAPSCWIEQVCRYYGKPVPEGAYYYQ